MDVILVVQKSGIDQQGGFTQTVLLYHNPMGGAHPDDEIEAKDNFHPGGEIPTISWESFKSVTQFDYPRWYSRVKAALASATKRRKVKFTSQRTLITGSDLKELISKQAA